MNYHLTNINASDTLKIAAKQEITNSCLFFETICMGFRQDGCRVKLLPTNELAMMTAHDFAKPIVRDAYARGNPTITVETLENNSLGKYCALIISSQ